MPSLTKVQKLHLIDLLATFYSFKEARARMHEMFGIDIDAKQIYTYDASNPKVRNRLSDVFVQRFDEVRTAYMEETKGIALASKAHRLRLLTENERKARGMGNIALSNATIEQAAKEVGEQFTNRAILETHDARPAVQQSPTALLMQRIHAVDAAGGQTTTETIAVKS